MSPEEEQRDWEEEQRREFEKERYKPAEEAEESYSETDPDWAQYIQPLEEQLRKLRIVTHEQQVKIDLLAKRVKQLEKASDYLQSDVAGLYHDLLKKETQIIEKKIATERDYDMEGGEAGWNSPPGP